MESINTTSICRRLLKQKLCQQNEKFLFYFLPLWHFTANEQILRGLSVVINFADYFFCRPFRAASTSKTAEENSEF